MGWRDRIEKEDLRTTTPSWRDRIEPDVQEPSDFDLGKSSQAALEHYGNAASMGYLPELQAVTEKPMAQALDYMTGNQVAQDLPDYVTRRDENRARLTQQEKENPVASTIGTVGGTVASSVPLGGALSGLSAPATLGGRLATAAGVAGAQGFITNPGDESGVVDPLQLQERLKQGATSAALGGALHAGGEGLSNVGKFIANRLKGKAEDLAFRALGPFKRQVNQNRDEIREIGREALDSGIIGWTPSRASTIEQRAEEAALGTGQKLGTLTDELAKLEGQTSYSGMTRKQIAENLKEKLLSENKSGIPGVGKRNQYFKEMIDDFQKDPKIKALAEKMETTYENALKFAETQGYKPTPLSFSDLREAKMAVQGTEGQEGLINWNRLRNADIPLEEQFHRALAQELRKGEEEGATAIEKAFYGQGSNRMKDLKDQFGRQKVAAQIAGNRADARRANQIMGLKDSIYGGAGATVGSILGQELGSAHLGGAVGAFGSKAAREIGPQISSKTLDALSNLMDRSPVIKTILQKNPSLIPQLIRNLESQN